MFSKRNKRASLYLNNYISPAAVIADPSLPDIAGMTLWLKADEGVYADAALTTLAVNGNNVRGWNDYSGASNEFVEANMARVPTFVTNVQNGLPVVRFVDGFLVSTPKLTSDLIANNALTMFVVFSVASIATNSANSWSNDTVIGENSGYVGLTLRQASTVNFYNYDGSDDKVTSTVTVGGTCAAFMCRHEGGNLYLSKNNGSESSAASGNTALMSGLIYIGNGIGPVLPFKGDIAEILIYNVALTALQIQQVYTYLNAKWSLY